jgi:hypothetical protein
VVPTTIDLYDIGDIATVSAAFTDTTGADADPTTVTATGYAPDGTVTNYTVTPGQIAKDATGRYHLDIPVTLAGDYSGAFNGSGTVTASAPWAFTGVQTPTRPSATALTTMSAARDFVLGDMTDGSQDSRIRRLINAYSAAVYSYTRREWLPLSTAVTRKFTYTGGGFLSFEPFELRNLTSITMYTDLPTADQRILITGTSTVQGEYRLHPPNRTAEGTYQWLTMPQAAYGVSSFGTPAYYNNPYPYGPVGRTAPLDFEVTVVGDWGVGFVPDDVELAVLIAIRDAYENPAGMASGIEGGLAFSEEPDATTGPESRARNLPIESRALLAPYKRGTQVVVA